MTVVSMRSSLWGVVAATLLAGSAWAQVQLQPLQMAGQILIEDFENQPLDNWVLSDGAQVVAVGHGAALGFAGPGLAVWQVPETRDLAFSFRMKLGKGTAVVKLCVAGEGAQAREYAVTISPSEAAVTWATGSTQRDLARKALETTTTAWHDYMVVLTDIGIELWQNGVSVAGANLERKLPPGLVAIGCAEGQGVGFDDLALGPPATAGQGTQGGVQAATPIPLPGPVSVTDVSAAKMTPAGPGATQTLSADLGGAPMSPLSGEMMRLGGVPMFLNLQPEVKGDCTTEGFEGWVRVADYRYALGPLPSDTLWPNDRFLGGGSAAAERTLFTALTILKPVDQASPKLHVLCAGGKIFATAKLVVAGGTKQAPLLTLELNEVRVVGIRALGPGATGGGPMEEVGFGFGKMKWTVAGPNGPVSATWDLQANKAQ